MSAQLVSHAQKLLSGTVFATSSTAACAKRWRFELTKGIRVPSDTATWISLVQLVISIVGVIITVWLALIVQRGAARITQLEFARALQDSWIHVDDVTLRDPDLIRLAQQYWPPHKTSDPGFGQKRLYLFIYLSPLLTTYQAARQGLFGKASAESIETIKQQLAYVVRDDDAYWVTQNQGYDPDFRALCREVREKLETAAGPEPVGARHGA